MTSEPQTLSCDRCGAKCCRYVATEIDRPTCKRDYDHIRWYLLHKNVHVFIDDERKWFLEFDSDCEALGADHRCGVYDDRPRICRTHGEDGRGCEVDEESRPCLVRFSAAPEFEAYLDQRGIDWRYKRF